MLKYCKVVNEETKQVMVGIGDNIDYYKSIGFTEQEVEQDYKGCWYLQGYGEKKPAEQVKKEKQEQLKIELENNFYSKYPLYKQCNIAIYGTDKERNEFKDFHDKLVEEYKKKLLELENVGE